VTVRRRAPVRATALQHVSDLDRLLPEKAYQQRLLDHLRACGWIAYHTFDSRRSAAGFPDVVASHPTWHRVVWIEVKRVTGRVTEAQEAWLVALADAGQEVRVVRPQDWDSFVAWVTPPWMIKPAPERPPERF